MIESRIPAKCAVFIIPVHIAGEQKRYGEPARTSLLETAALRAEDSSFFICFGKNTLCESEGMNCLFHLF